MPRYPSFRSRYSRVWTSIIIGRIFGGFILAALATSWARADDVPFEWYGDGNTSGQATLNNGQLTATFHTKSGEATLTGDLRDGSVNVTIFGSLGAEPHSCTGQGTSTEVSGTVRINVAVRCWITWAGVLVLHLPETGVTNTNTNQPSNDYANEIDVIQTRYVAIADVEVRSTYDGSYVPMGNIKNGDEIYVVGKLKDKPWYEVSLNDQYGFVPENSLEPSGTVAPTPASASASQVATTAPPPANSASAVAPAATTSELGSLDFGRYVALVIGNNSYRNGLPALKTAVGDAIAIAQALRTEYGFKVTLLTNATREQILQALTHLRLTLTWDDNLLIYYAGHGSYDPEADQGYWLPVDARSQDPTNWVSNNDITTMLKAIQARHIMVVADSCYSGSLTRDANVDIRDAKYLERMVGKKARTVMTSGGLEPVTDSGGSGHSVFARAFLAVLADNTGIMDAETFFEVVRKPVVLGSQQTPEYSNLRSAGHEGGDFVFVRKQ
jgi:hypothetical protein